jgi:hypothetical protein
MKCGMRDADCGMEKIKVRAFNPRNIPHSAFRNPHSAFKG